MVELFLSFFSFGTIVDYVMHFKVVPRKANYERRVDVDLACFEPRDVDADETVLIDDDYLILNITFSKTRAIQILQPKIKGAKLEKKCVLYALNKPIAYVYPKDKGNFYNFFFVALDPKTKYSLVCKFKLSPSFSEKNIKPAIVNNYDWREYLSVFFPLGSFELTSKIKFELNKFLKVIPKDKICILYLIGYADNTPIVRPETLKKVKSNKELAYKRVKNVLDYLLGRKDFNYKPMSEEKLLKEYKKRKEIYRSQKEEKRSSNLEEKKIKNSKVLNSTKEIYNSNSSIGLNEIFEILNNLSKDLKKGKNG